MNNRPNTRRPHLIPTKWRALMVRGRRKLAANPHEVQQTIAALEEFIVKAEDRRPHRRKLHVLAPDTPTVPDRAELPLLSDQAARLSAARMKIMLTIGLLGLLLIGVTFWLLHRLAAVF